MSDSRPIRFFDEWHEIALAAGESDGEPTSSSGGPGHTISGVAMPPNSTALSDGDELFFPASETKEAADTLAGESISVGHPDDWPYPVGETVGRITQSAWDSALGLVYEGVISDDSIAEKIESGILDVSAHVMSNDGDETDGGRITAEDMRFIGLGLVSRGAVDGNSVDIGELALSVDALPERAGEDGPAQAVNVALEANKPSVEEQLRSRISTLSEKLEDRGEKLDELLDAVREYERAQLERDRAGDHVAEAYATALAQDSALTSERLLESMSLEELGEEYDAAIESGALSESASPLTRGSDPSESESGGSRTHTGSPAEPDVQSGGGQRSHALSGGDAKRSRELKSDIEELQSLPERKMTTMKQVVLEQRQEALEELRAG